MLVNFRFSNFLSYNELSHFSMVSGNTRRHKKHVKEHKDVSVLKFASLYGANASGKTNLVKAIDFSRKLVVQGFPNVISRDLHCKVASDNQTKSTAFEYEIILEDIVYVYGFSVNLFEKKIDSEWLYSLAGDEEVKIFIRDHKQDHQTNFKYEQLKLNQADEARLDIYASDLANKATNSLLITELNDNKQSFYSGDKKSVLNQIYEWFLNKLEVVSPNRPTNEADNISYFEKKKQLALSNFLDAFGTGVKEVKTKRVQEKDLYKEMPSVIVKEILEKVNEKEGNGGMLRTDKNIYEIEKVNNELIINTLLFKHEIDGVYYSLGEESDGTIRLIEIYDILVSENDKVYVVDEIDRSLHPNLTFNYVKEFLEKDNNSQLIVTTHEDRLLDLEVLRRDEIWFVEKQENGSSKLYSLEAFKERFDKDILKAYLEGRYGSIPRFQDLFN